MRCESLNVKGFGGRALGSPTFHPSRFLRAKREHRSRRGRLRSRSRLSKAQTLFSSTLARASAFFVLADFFSIPPGLNGVYGRFTEEWRESGIQSGPGRIAPAPWCAGSFNRGREREYLIWCRRRDLNPHGLRHTPLKRACLPFHHFGNRIREASFVSLPKKRAQGVWPIAYGP